MDPQEQLVNLRAALDDMDARGQGVIVEWDPPTPVWRTARLTLRREDAEVLVFEDVGELVFIPPNESHPRPLPSVGVDETADVLVRALGR